MKQVKEHALKQIQQLLQNEMQTIQSFNPHQIQQMQQSLGMLQIPDLKYFFGNFAKHFYKTKLEKQISNLLKQPKRVGQTVTVFQLPEDFDLDNDLFDYDELQDLQDDAPVQINSTQHQYQDQIIPEFKKDSDKNKHPKTSFKKLQINQQKWIEDADIQTSNQQKMKSEKKFSSEPLQFQSLEEIKPQVLISQKSIDENAIKHQIDQGTLIIQPTIDIESKIKQTVSVPQSQRDIDFVDVQQVIKSEKKMQKCKIKREKKDSFIRLQLDLVPPTQRLQQTLPIPILQEIPIKVQTPKEVEIFSPQQTQVDTNGREGSNSRDFSEVHKRNQFQSPVKQRTSVRRDKCNTTTICHKCKQEKPRLMNLMINEFFICAQCLLKLINPLQDIVDILCEGNLFIVKNSQLNIETQTIPFTLNSCYQQRQDLAIDIRCIQLSEQGMVEMTFPQSCIMTINNKQLKQTKPLLFKSCLHKRKDCAILVKNINCLRYGNTQAPNNFVVRQVPVYGEFRSDKPGTQYMFALFLVKPKSIPKLIGEIQQSQILQGKEDFVQRIRSQFMENEVHVEQVKISLRCQYTLDLIDIPARGKYCYHLQCFSLENFLIMMQKSEHKRWFCPICKKICFELEIDKYQQYIIMQIKKFKLDITEIKFTSDGDLDLPLDQKNKILGQNPYELQMQIIKPHVQLGSCEESAIFIE